MSQEIAEELGNRETLQNFTEEMDRLKELIKILDNPDDLSDENLLELTPVIKECNQSLATFSKRKSAS
jgi:hypothetical protein